MTEYIYLDDYDRVVGKLHLADNLRQKNWDVAMGFKHLCFPNSTVYLKVFNQ